MPPRSKRARPVLPPRSAEVLDVHGAAALLMVSTDTVYDLFGRGELPGRKVGRKWISYPWVHRNLPRPALRATPWALRYGRGSPPMHYADKLKPAHPEGSRLNAKRGSRLEAN
jgi:excisionase family DNA binding protein